MADLVFVIGGNDYPAPTLETFDMSERRVMFDLAGVVEEDFVQADGESEEEHDARVSRMTRHPGFMEALMHVAYQRGNPELSRSKVQALIDKTNFHEAIQKWGEAEPADDADPPLSGSTRQHDVPSPTNSSSPNGTSGGGSESTSDERDSGPETTGTPESDTSPTSLRSLSAA